MKITLDNTLLLAGLLMCQPGKRGDFPDFHMWLQLLFWWAMCHRLCRTEHLWKQEIKRSYPFLIRCFATKVLRLHIKGPLESTNMQKEENLYMLRLLVSSVALVEITLSSPKPRQCQQALVGHQLHIACPCTDCMLPASKGPCRDSGGCFYISLTSPHLAVLRTRDSVAGQSFAQCQPRGCACFHNIIVK